MDASAGIAERDLAIQRAVQEKGETIQEKEILAQENESLSRLLQETIQGNNGALHEKDAEIQRLQVYCV